MDREPLLQRVRDRARAAQNGTAGTSKTQCDRGGRCSCGGANETSSCLGDDPVQIQLPKAAPRFPSNGAPSLQCGR